MNLPAFFHRLALCLVLALPALAWAAEPVARVTHLSGLLSAKHLDGTSKILAVKSEIFQGDILSTEKDTYAKVKFVDQAEVVLRPDTQLSVERYSYDAAKPQSDSIALNIFKGGMRAVTGLIGKRNKEAVSYTTPTATIGIRGTTFVAQYVPPPSASPSTPPSGPSAPTLAPGLYVQVIDGLINLSNKGGSQNFSAGQFGFTPSFTQPPIIVPQNPGLQFTPPPAFNHNAAAPGAATPGATGSSDDAAGAVDCVVR
jgi:hypothetical protein